MEKKINMEKALGGKIYIYILSNINLTAPLSNYAFCLYIQIRLDTQKVHLSHRGIF